MRCYRPFVLFALSLGMVACQSKPPATAVSPTPIVVTSGISPVAAAQAQKQSGAGYATATGLGVLLSGWASPDISAALDDTDRMKNQQAERRAYTAQIGQQVTWTNQATGHSGAIVPLRDGYSQSGAYCRDFKQAVLFNAQQKQGNVHVCQQADGSWKIAR